MVMEHKNLNYYKTQHLKLWKISKTQNLKKLKNSSCDKTLKNQVLTKLKMWQNSKSDQTQKLKLWQNSKTQIDTKLKNSKGLSCWISSGSIMDENSVPAILTKKIGLPISFFFDETK